MSGPASPTKSNSCTVNNFFNSRSVGLIAIGTVSVIVGLFILLAAKQVPPQGVNTISTWNVDGCVTGISVMGVGVILILLGIYWGCRTHPNREKGHTGDEDASHTLHPTISATTQINTERQVSPSYAVQEYEFAPFSIYDCTEPDIAYARARNIHFFHGNCDGVMDLGWGCAWRSIQICVSALNLFPSFQDLYNQYRTTKSEHEWAEPGYGNRYLDDQGIPSLLVLYKRNEGTPKTPTAKCTYIIKDFLELRTFMIGHLETHSTPIMADDEMYAYTIIGIRVTPKNETILFIADPHKTDHASGLYYVVLDGNGQQIATTGIDDGENGLRTVRSVFFTKGWMLLFPQPRVSSR